MASFLRNTASFLIGAVLAKAFGAVQTYWLAKELGPSDYGVWFTLLLLVSYSPILCLGVGEVLQKQIPKFQASNDIEAIQRTEGSVLGFSLLTSLLILVIASVTATIVLIYGNYTYAINIGILSVAVCASYFSTFFLERFEANQNFGETARTATFRSFVSVTAVCGLALLWGLRGALIGYLVHELLTLAFSARRSIKLNGNVAFRYDMGAFKNAVTIGLPITAIRYVFILQNSADRAIIGAFLPSDQAGFYGIAVACASILALLPTAVGRVLYPRVNFELARSVSSPNLHQLVMGAGFSLALAMTLIQIAIIITMPYLYGVLLPAYKEGLQAGVVLILGVFSIGLMRTAVNVLIAADRQGRVMAYAGFTLCLNVALNVTFVRLGYGIAGVACGTSLAALVLNLLVWRRAMQTLRLTNKESRANLLLLYLPLILLLFELLALRSAFRTFLSEFSPALVVLGILLSGFNILLLALIPAYRREINRWLALASTKLRHLRITSSASAL